MCLEVMSAWLPKDLEDNSSWVLFGDKNKLWWFWFSLFYNPGEQARAPLSPAFLCGHYPYSIQTTRKTTGSQMLPQGLFMRSSEGRGMERCAG